jgi:peptidoglycan/xylan/chitin deacetylase (PgdA/CDA1 family)
MLRRLLGGLSRKAARLHCSKPFRMQNREPLVSFTFDDVPDSAYVNGAKILDEAGIHGTFYIASGICGTSDTHWRVIETSQVRALHDSGHEIGCHTFSHVAVETLNATAMTDETERNGERLMELCPGIQLTNFCYPFGKLSLQRKLQLQERFDTCRGIYEGINVGKIDLALLRVIELYDRTLTEEKLERVLRETRERNGWLVFYTHDVADPPSWIGCSPAKFKSTVEAVQTARMRCLPIRAALSEIGFDGSAERSVASQPTVPRPRHAMQPRAW